MAADSVETVVVGVDGSDYSERALTWAVRYATVTGARLHLVTVWEWPTAYGAGGVFPTFDPEAAGEQILQKARADVALPDTRVMTSLLHGPPPHALARASADADLLVVGSKGHGAVAAVFVGSVSLYCVHHARPAVVVVH